MTQQANLPAYHHTNQGRSQPGAKGASPLTKSDHLALKIMIKKKLKY